MGTGGWWVDELQGAAGGINTSHSCGWKRNVTACVDASQSLVTRRGQKNVDSQT